MDRQAYIDGFVKLGLGSPAFWVFLRVLDSGGRAYIPYRATARRLGIDHKSLTSAVRSLLARGVLVRGPGPELGLAPAFPGVMVSPPQAGAGEMVSPDLSQGGEMVSPTPPPSGEMVSPGWGNGFPSAREMVSPPGEMVSPLITERERERKKTPPLSPPEADDGFDTPLATVNGRDDQPVVIAGTVNDPAEVRRVSRLADDLFPLLEFGMQVERYRRAWPIAWVERALIDAAAWSSPPRNFIAIIKRLQRWQEAGGPPALGKSPDWGQEARGGAPGARANPFKSVYGGMTKEEVLAGMKAQRREAATRAAAGG